MRGVTKRVGCARVRVRPDERGDGRYPRVVIGPFPALSWPSLDVLAVGAWVLGGVGLSWIAPAFERMYREVGVELPGLTSAAFALAAPAGLLSLVAVAVAATSAPALMSPSERWERRWVALSLLLAVAFVATTSVALLAPTTSSMGIQKL